MAKINIHLHRDPFQHKPSNTGNAIRAAAISTTRALLAFEEVFEVVANRQDNTFDLTNFSSSPRAVPAINPYLYQWVMAGDAVIVEYENFDRNRPRIIAWLGHISHRQIILLALWSQIEGNSQLSRYAATSIIGQHGSNTLFTGQANGSATPFGLCVTSDSKVVICEPLRDGGDTYWEKLRLSLQIPFGALTTLECAISTSPAYFLNSANMWINGDASFCVVLDSATPQVFRKRSTVFTQVTLANLTTLYPSGILGVNVSAAGLFVAGAYKRFGYSYIADCVAGTDEVYTKSTSAPTNCEKIHAWALDVDSITPPEIFAYDPTYPFTLSRVAANGAPDDAVSFINGVKWPFNAAASEFVVWVSGHELLPYTTAENQSILLGYDGTIGSHSPFTRNLRQDVQRYLQACVSGIDANSGGVNWTHRIDVAATAPVQDSGLLSPLDAFFTTYTPTLVGFTTYIGMAADRSLTANGTYSGSGELDTLFPTKGGAATFSAPTYDVFQNAAITILPLPTSNDIAPTLQRDFGSGKYNTMALFTDYCKPGVNGMNQFPHIVADTEDCYYFAYTSPVQYLISGTIAGPNEGLGITDNSWRDLVLRSYITGIDYDAHWLPDSICLYQRKIRKISKSGAFLAEYDATQLVTASWYELDSILGGADMADPPVGGDSAFALPLIDNVWKICPCGRVVFVIADFHDLGAIYKPTTMLLILNSATLALLHTIKLRDSEGVIGANLMDGGDIAYRNGEREYAPLPLTIEVRTGSIGNDQEWAAVWYAQERRNAFPVTAIGIKMLLLRMDTDITSSPIIVSNAADDTNTGSVGIVAASRVDLTYDGLWHIRQQV